MSRQTTLAFTPAQKASAIDVEAESAPATAGAARMASELDADKSPRSHKKQRVDSTDGASSSDAASSTSAAAASSSAAAVASSSTAGSKPSFRLQEVKGDLFSCDASSSLAHCVSVCLAMGKGVAVPFKEKFGGVAELKAQKRQIGQVAVLQRDKRFIYYLVSRSAEARAKEESLLPTLSLSLSLSLLSLQITKERYFHKPTYASLEQSLISMREHMRSAGVKRLAMPKIGSGLDALQWPKVKDMIERVFKDSDCEITIYAL
jgi:O-acetyl-ADP-ribose deacetylase (regulator of RNase III)